MHELTTMALLETAMLWVALLGMASAAAVVVFIEIQAYLHDPERKVRNEAWFAKFDENMRKRYSDPALAWRITCFQGHFDSQH